MMNDLGLGIIVSLKDAFTQNATRIQSSMESLDSSVAKASENMTRNLGLIEKGTMMVGAGLALLARAYRHLSHPPQRRRRRSVSLHRSV